MDTSELLADYARILNRHGADSREAAEFMQRHRWNGDLADLAETARLLKLALSSA